MVPGGCLARTPLAMEAIESYRRHGSIKKIFKSRSQSLHYSVTRNAGEYGDQGNYDDGLHNGYPGFPGFPYHPRASNNNIVHDRIVDDIATCENTNFTLKLQP